MISDLFKEVYLAQTAPSASHLSEQGPAVICRMMLLPGQGVVADFLQIIYCIISFPKEAGCLLNKPWYFCESCPKTLM